MNRDVARLVARYCDAPSLIAWSQVCSAYRRWLDETVWSGWESVAADLEALEPRANDVLFPGMQNLRHNVLRSKNNNRKFCLFAVAVLARRNALKTIAGGNSEPVCVGVFGEGRQRLCALLDGSTWSVDYIPTLWEPREYLVMHAGGKWAQWVVLRDTMSSTDYCCAEEWRMRVEGLKPRQDVFIALVDSNVLRQKHVAQRIRDIRSKCETQFLVCGVDDFEVAAQDWDNCQIGPNWVTLEHATAVSIMIRAVELATKDETTARKCIVQ